MNVILIGHACGPRLGSEPGNTWNLSNFLSREHTIWVLTHPQHRESIDAFVAENPNPNLNFVYVTISPAIDPWKPGKSERGLRFHYLLWQRAAARTARELCTQHRIDVVHHYSLGTIKAPPHLSRMTVPVVWGPMGGGQTMPPAFARYFKGQVVSEYLRIALAKVQPFMPALRRMVRKAAVVLANNRETFDLMKKAGARNAHIALETAVPAAVIDEHPPARHGEQRLTVLWAGRLETRKALPLALEALAKTKMPVTLQIAGEGEKRADCEALARELGISDRVKFLGRLPFEKMAAAFRESDAFLFTSLRDSTGAVVIEAMAKGLAIVTLNHQGMRTMVPDDAGFKIDPTTPAETILGLAAALDELAKSPARRLAMSAAALACARENTWEKRAEQISNFYREATGAGRNG